MSCGGQKQRYTTSSVGFVIDAQDIVFAYRWQGTVLWISRCELWINCERAVRQRLAAQVFQRFAELKNFFA